MAQYQIPQFIETESKIVGPFTFKQFIYLASGAVVIFLLQYVLSGSLLFTIAIVIAALAAGLAFFKIDGVPLPQYILMAFGFALGTKRYIYQTDQNQNNIENIINKKS